MPEPARPVTAVTDFPGLSDVPRSAINQPPGTASEQINVCSILKGELTVRHGTKEVNFEA